MIEIKFLLSVGRHENEEWRRFFLGSLAYDGQTDKQRGVRYDATYRENMTAKRRKPLILHLWEGPRARQRMSTSGQYKHSFEVVAIGASRPVWIIRHRVSQ